MHHSTPQDRSPDRLEPWLAALRDEPTPTGLADRTYRAVLARGNAAAPRLRWFAPALGRRAAAVLLAIGAAGLGGYYLSGDYLSGGLGSVVAKHQGRLTEGEALALRQAWIDLGASPELAAEILRQRAAFAESPLPSDPAERTLEEDRQEGQILALLPPDVRARYAERTGQSAAEITRLLRLGEESPR